MEHHKTLIAMIKFDKIKIIAPISAIEGYEGNDLFQTTTQGDEVIRYKLSYNHPTLHVIITPKEYKVSIEFTGKILGEHYPQLINKESIRECFDRINSMGFFHLDTNTILRQAEVIQCDVTCDLTFPNLNRLRDVINTHLNTPKWAIQQYSGGIVIAKTVKTSKYKRRLSIYDKGAEMRLKDNTDYIALLKNSEEIENYFHDKIRFELNLTSKQAIRDALSVISTDVMTVLNSPANPIREAILEAIHIPTEERQVSTLRDFERLIVLEYFNFELPKLKNSIRKFYKDSNGLNKTIKAYRELTLNHTNTDYSWLNALLDQAA